VAPSASASRCQIVAVLISGLGFQHRVDVVVQAVERRGLAVDLLPIRRVGRGECLDDGAAADVLLPLDRPL
jgi:hypothetical protein